MRLVFKCAALGALLSVSGSGALLAQSACIDFKWDVHKERALFAAEPLTVSAGADAGSAPKVRPNHLYQVRLKPRSGVRFAVPPGQSPDSTWGSAGLLSLDVPAAGSYRVVLELSMWADVVAGGKLLAPYDYQGQRDCSAPHKIVVFELPAKPLILQLSGVDSSTVRIGLTSAPPRVR
jgi:hypothetical protein